MSPHASTNITSLDASSSLAAIDALNPVTFNWIDPTESTAPQIGFIAQQVQQLFPALISTTSPTPLTSGGTLGLNYIGLISPIVSAIQALTAGVTSLEALFRGLQTVLLRIILRPMICAFQNRTGRKFA